MEEVMPVRPMFEVPIWSWFLWSVNSMRNNVNQPGVQVDYRRAGDAHERVEVLIVAVGIIPHCRRPELAAPDLCTRGYVKSVHPIAFRFGIHDGPNCSVRHGQVPDVERLRVDLALDYPAVQQTESVQSRYIHGRRRKNWFMVS